MTDHKAKWVLVPRVATDAMVTAARGFSVPGYCVAAEQWPTIYAAMLAASPAPDEFQAAADDLVIYGTAIMRDGKRIDPRDVWIAAAPAASEGEDGAVAQLRDAHERRLYNVTAAQALAPLLAPGYRLIYRDAFRWKDANGSVLSNHYDGMDAAQLAADFGHELVADLTFAAVIRDTRPAAQVAATPKHDEGREALLDQISKLQAFKDYVHGRLDDAGIPKNPEGQHSDAGCRVGDRLDIALATQPASRRVTDGPLAELARRALPFLRDEADKYDDDGSNEPLELAREIEAALESFAQPAEGVSGG